MQRRELHRCYKKFSHEIGSSYLYGQAVTCPLPIDKHPINKGLFQGPYLLPESRKNIFLSSLLLPFVVYKSNIFIGTAGLSLQLYNRQT